MRTNRGDTKVVDIVRGLIVRTDGPDSNLKTVHLTLK